MDKKQKECFEMVYKHVHDERSSNANLAMFIDICFPDPNENDVSLAMHRAIKPYLEARAGMGKASMKLLYMLKEAVNNGSC